MVTIVKHEWHQHDRQYAIELDEALLSEIYPDLDEDEIAQKLADIESGEVDYEEVFSDAIDNDVEIEWEFQYDDCWTDRKGGYDVTYELGDEDSWHHEPEPDPPTHKCTNCKWEGTEYEGQWTWEDKNGNELDEPKSVCKYCESDIELTEFGTQKKKESDERRAQWDKEAADDEDEELEEGLDELKRELEQIPVPSPAHWPTPESDFVETAKWPFDNPGEVEDEDDESLKESYPEDTYTIRIWGRTREIGVMKITQMI